MISKEMSLLELLQAYPQSREILEKHGMACLRCMGAADETIENGARMHGINVEALLADLNKLVQKN
ncbi:DUF1858 domain-containing protein [Zhaonella formicivorans]|jgi:hybrid cluster-associated redox disulfide protein|uniref:DUF1858 domain-containing protein n=1 Tax=Zhaonella formicivorans TaxID=2528593 RepID=UPI0010E9B4DC|nr:DUF1858 domain-containing protein [Zhaonella formicivorans]